MLCLSARSEGSGRARPATTSREPVTPGDADFDRLIRPLLGDLLRLARRRLGCDHAAWEAVQESLLVLWSLPEAPPNPRAWLIRAVIFRSLHMERTARRRRRHESEARVGRDEVDDRDDPARRLATDELRAEVRSAMGKLDEDHRTVLVLHVLERLDYRSIGIRLGIPTGTVRSRLSRARDALKARLRPDLESLP